MIIIIIVYVSTGISSNRINLIAITDCHCIVVIFLKNFYRHYRINANTYKSLNAAIYTKNIINNIVTAIINIIVITARFIMSSCQ